MTDFKIRTNKSMVAGRERFGYAAISRFVPVICGSFRSYAAVAASASQYQQVAKFWHWPVRMRGFDDSRTISGTAMRFGLLGALLGLMLGACADRPPRFDSAAQPQ